MKNYLKKTIKVIFGVLLVSTQMWSCKKFVDTKPKTQLLAEYIFDTDATVTAALNGVYTQFVNPTANVFTTSGLLADELSSPSIYPIKSNSTYTADDTQNQFNFFEGYYNAIYNANGILEGIDKAPKISQVTKDFIKGEALFLRAYAHFQLTNFWGDVPYVTMTDPNVSAFLPNAPRAAIYQNIIADLKISAGLLTNTYAVANRTRANKQVVNALLAKVYLYSKDWANAEKSATDVIGSGLYRINNDLNSVFTSTSNETIFQAWNVRGYFSPGFLQFNITSSVTYAVRPALVDAFGAGDLRKGNWIRVGTGPAVETNTYVVTKYKKDRATAQNDGIVAPEEYGIFFRLAEMYLIRAEARAQQNTPASIVAGATDMEVTRSRAGLTTPLVITTSAQLLTAIADERRKELSFENANRWFDLKRGDQTQAVATLAAIKPGFDAHYLLLPYARKYTTLNKYLIQNPGYN